MPLQTHVSVAKAGVDAMSNSVAIEFGPRGVRSNVIAPGPIGGTEGMERLAKSEDVAEGLKNIPLGRWGTVKEIADATVYLFSDAGNYVNGQTLVGEYNPHFSWKFTKVNQFQSMVRLGVPTGRIRGLGSNIPISFSRMKS